MSAGNRRAPAPPAVSVEEELRRVMPVVERLAPRWRALVSVDTSNPGGHARARWPGRSMINDVAALQRPGALGGRGRIGLRRVPDAHAG